MCDTNKQISERKEYLRKYYLENKEIWAQKIHCEICNTNYVKANNAHHLKSKKHKLKEYELKFGKI